MTETLPIALILFLAAALVGVALFVRNQRHESLPVSLAAGHGALAVAGVVLLSLAVLGGAEGPASVALIIFAITALGGIFLVSFHVRGRSLPTRVILVHAAAGVAGAIALLMAVLGGS
jgi:hypothetical protein